MLLDYSEAGPTKCREALQALKPMQVIRAEVDADDIARFDMVWPDGQVSTGRWILRPGDKLDTRTGATYGPDQKPVDDADLGIGTPE